MSSEIIQLSAFRPKFGVKSRNATLSTASDRPRTAAGYFLKEPATDTCKNQRLRGDRRDVWREADAVMDYWYLSMKLDGVISRVQKHGRPEGELHPQYDPQEHWTILAKYRKAWARLMLTPAPDMRSVTWKRAQLKAGSHKHTDLTTVRIERAIADDVEFLKAHPTRQSRGADGKGPRMENRVPGPGHPVRGAERHRQKRTRLARPDQARTSCSLRRSLRAQL